MSAERDNTQLEKAAALQATDLCAGLGKEGVQGLAAISEEREYEAGEVLFREGEVATGFGLVLSGSADVLISTGTGMQVLLGSVTTGTGLGLNSTLDDLPHPVTAIATCSVLLLFFPKESLLGLLRKSPELWLLITALLSSSIRQIYQWNARICRALRE